MQLTQLDLFADYSPPPAVICQDTTHTLRGEGFDASEDGTGRGTPMVPVNFQASQSGMRINDTVGTIDANYGGRRHNGVMVPVAFDTTQITSPANYSNPQPGDPCHPLAAGAHVPAIAFPANLSGTQHASAENIAPSMGAKNPTAVAAYGFQPRIARNGRGDMGDVVAALNALSGETGKGDAAPCVATAMQVRRLTPVECERLQGFPDGYTAIPWRKKPASECPDGPRYKALGNSWAVPNVRWIGRRIDAHLRELTIANDNTISTKALSA